MTIQDIFFSVVMYAVH